LSCLHSLALNFCWARFSLEEGRAARISAAMWNPMSNLASEAKKKAKEAADRVAEAARHAKESTKQAVMPNRTRPTPGSSGCTPCEGSIEIPRVCAGNSPSCLSLGCERSNGSFYNR
jgi:hypothetical protein